MAAQEPVSTSSVAIAYDRKAEEYNWRGPEVAFGLSYSFVNPGESVLDIAMGRALALFCFIKLDYTCTEWTLRPRCSKLADQRDL